MTDRPTPTGRHIHISTHAQEPAREKPSTSSEEHEHSNDKKDGSNTVSLRDRLRHFTWAWFTSTMSTGGLTIALASTPHRFPGLTTIGIILFLFNLILFLLLSSLMTTRLILDPPRFRKSFTHPPESFFFGSFLLSIAVIIGGIQLYGITLGPEVERKWLIPTIRILYWLYASVSLLNAIIQYWVFIQRTPARPIPMNPSWFLPIYSAMLTGTIASVIAPSQPPHYRLPIIISGIAYKGFGWTVAFVFIVLYIARLLEAGLPPPSLRPAMFIPVGSAAYTVVAFIGNARAIPRDYGYFAAHPHAADSLQATALFFGVILWLVAFWLFALAVLSCFAGIKEMRFSSAWWAFIFPNVGFMLATAEIGREVESEGILWVASGMTGVVVIMWLVTVGACGKAVVEKRVLWPGRDEDKDM